jgi:hippurate hydrolase
MDARNLPSRTNLTKGLAEKKRSRPCGFVKRLAQVAVVLGIPANAVFVWAETPQEWVAAEVPQLTQLYESLHQAPELSFQEENTSARMAELLRELGLTVTEQVGGHGVVGVLENGVGKTLLLRADMDALPVVEVTELPYASQVKTRDERGATVGVMHACGHDMHMTNLVGAVRFLASHRDLWQGTLVVIFQPAEERGAGAQAMIDDGLLSRFPRPNYAVALHVAADRPAGTVGYRAGYACANVDSVDITIRGRGGHGAYPHTTIDPVVIAARLVLDLQTIVSREIDPIEPAVITIGSIHGGTKHNVIGDTCELQLTVRSYTPEVREQLLKSIRRKALAAAASSNAPEPEVKVSEGTPALFNDPQLTARVVAALKPALGEANVIEVPPTMGGEDFGRFGGAGVPIVMLQLGAVNSERLDEFKKAGTPPPSLHSPKFYPDPERTITTGVATLATAAMELLRPTSE